MKKKNKIICSILGIFLVAFISLMVISKINPSLMERFGTSEYFVQINTDGKLEPDRDLWPYYYETNAYNKDGDEIKVRFYAEKNLRKGAYLSLAVLGDKDKNDIHDIRLYEEVNPNQVPSIAKSDLDSKH
ncbi:YxeA family protein [Clostridium baratii]|uniref:YxeA family protein n=1 Tax=Clostridium baratii TaxID=1561 RepID=UPI0036F37C4B